MKNIRTIMLLSATCLTIMGAETSFASLNGASLLDYKGALATSTSICNHIIPSPKGNVKSHTHLVAASPSPHLSSSNLPQTSTLVANVCFVTDTGECRGNQFEGGLKEVTLLITPHRLRVVPVVRAVVVHQVQGHHQVVHLHQVHQVQVVVILTKHGALTIPNVAIGKAI